MKPIIRKMLSLAGLEVVRKHPVEKIAKKIYFQYAGHTMVPESLFVDNLKLAWDFRNVEGCVVECGVWKGGMSAGMASLLKEREFFLCDSFEGLPPAKEIDGKRALEWQSQKAGIYYYNNCKADAHFAEQVMMETGVTYHLIKGWYSDTLSALKLNQPIAILRLDSDWYESTWDCLVNLYSKVAVGGIIIFDDYDVFDGCSRAVHDFFSKNSLPVRMNRAYRGIAYLVKKH